MSTTHEWWTYAGLLVVIAFGGACNGKRAPAAIGDAGAPAASSSTRLEAGDARARRSVDLLHWGPARLAVSSNVKNPRDYPEHLVDGNEATAWNSRTGDLVGATITFEVPADATIESLVLSAGFAKISAAGEDLFQMNHRIRTVDVFADATEKVRVATLQLDPAKREPQSFPFAHPGGVYKLKVTAVEPGTKADWKELVVSEFRVMGIPGAVVYGMPRIPDVSISKEWGSRPLPGIGGARESSYQAALGTVHPNMSALCNHMTTKLEPEFKKTGQTPPPEKTACVAKAVAVPAPLPAPIKGISWVDLGIPEGFAGMYVIETDRGFVIPKNAELQSDPCEPGCMDDMTRVETHLEKVESTGGSITLHVKQTSSSTEAFDDRGVRTPATDTRWFSLKCALAPEPVTCARVETKTSCVMGGKEVTCP